MKTFAITTRDAHGDERKYLLNDRNDMTAINAAMFFDEFLSRVYSSEHESVIGIIETT